MAQLTTGINEPDGNRMAMMRKLAEELIASMSRRRRMPAAKERVACACHHD
jgi:hypothetical protein